MANGLINLQTDLKSLKYSSMPLGSQNPYVTKNIGQAPESQIGLEIQSRIDDTSRIAKMLVDKPGLRYLANEALLQQTDIQGKIERAKSKKDKTFTGAVLQQIGKTVLNTVKIAASTLAQVPVNGTGTHFIKGFRTDTYLQDVTTSGFAQFFGIGGVEGAQYALRGDIVPGTVGKDYQNFGTQEGNVFTIDSKIPKEYGYSKPVSKDHNERDNTPLPSDVDNRQTKFNAESGTPIIVAPPGKEIDTTLPSGSLSKLTPQSTGSYGAEELNIAQPETYNYSDSNTYTQTQQKRTISTGNKDVTKENRIRLGDQGAKITEEKQAARRKNQYWYMSDRVGKEGALSEVDEMNAIGVKSLKVDGNNDGRDIVKFRFHIITPDDEKILYFRAFLDTFNDNYTGTWNPIKYLGRAEDFQIYGGFQRKISLSFKIAAATRAEMKPLYQKMIWLASATAPTYAVDGQFMRGTIIKMTVGDYVYELPGVLNNLTYTWQQDYPWEIAMLEPEKGKGDARMQELPMIMDCQLDFTPIHTFTPETGLKKYFTAGSTVYNNYLLPDETVAAAEALLNVDI